MQNHVIMSKKTGVWLDRKSAYVVTLNNGEHRINTIVSDADFRVREDGEGKEYTRFGNQYGTKEKAREARLEQQLKQYYKNVLNGIKDAGELYIFGPAEAKNELHKMISGLTGSAIQITAIESSDKLTENQIVAAVKKHFES